jgi:hypothetical protein
MGVAARQLGCMLGIHDPAFGSFRLAQQVSIDRHLSR